MKNNFLIKQNTDLNELHFLLISSLCNNSAQCVYDKMMFSGLDDNTLGFWVWEIDSNVEYYSPTLKASLQYSSEEFPDKPDSWRKVIFEDDLKTALANFELHIASKGEKRYIQKVRYRRKYGDTLTVICHGLVVAWSENKPLLMIGVHMKPDGLYLKTK